MRAIINVKHGSCCEHHILVAIIIIIELSMFDDQFLDKISQLQG